MGVLDWLFGSKARYEGDERLRAAVERVIDGTDPRIRAVDDARERLAPAVEHALTYVHDLVGLIPPSTEISPEAWTHSPLLRAMFVGPADVASTLSNSPDLREFLGSPQAMGMDVIHCVVGATRIERTVFGAAMDGDQLRQDVAQKTVGFNDFRLAGFSPTEAALRDRVEEIALEGLLLAALRDIAENRQRGEQLETYRQLLLTRLRLMEQSGAGLDAMLKSDSWQGRDLERLRGQLAENEAELATLKMAGSGFETTLELVIGALRNAESVIRPQRVSFRLNSMNILVGPDAADASTIELLEFSSINPEHPRRVTFPVSFSRYAVAERHVNFDAMLQML